MVLHIHFSRHTGLLVSQSVSQSDSSEWNTQISLPPNTSNMATWSVAQCWTMALFRPVLTHVLIHPITSQLLYVQMWTLQRHIKDLFEIQSQRWSGLRVTTFGVFPPALLATPSQTERRRFLFPSQVLLHRVEPMWICFGVWPSHAQPRFRTGCSDVSQLWPNPKQVQLKSSVKQHERS